MKNPVGIEPIEDLRRSVGIDDAELRGQVVGVQVGDLVCLTFLSGTPSCQGETLPVRVTSIRGKAFRWQLGQNCRWRPMCPCRQETLQVSVHLCTDKGAKFTFERKLRGRVAPTLAAASSIERCTSSSEA